MGDFRRWYDAAIDALWVGDRGGVFLDDVQSLGMGRGGGAAADSQLAVDVLEVGFDGIDGDAQRLCDFLVGLTVSEQAQNVELAVAEWLDEGLRGRVWRCGGIRERHQQFAHILWRYALRRGLPKQNGQRFALIHESADVASRLGQRQPVGQEGEGGGGRGRSQGLQHAHLDHAKLPAGPNSRFVARFQLLGRGRLLVLSEEQAGWREDEERVERRGVGIVCHLLHPARGSYQITLRQRDLGVASSNRGTYEWGNVIVTGQPVGFFERDQRGRTVALGLPGACQHVITANLNLHVATMLAQFDPAPQVVGGGFQVVPLVEQSAQVNVGESDGRQLFPQPYCLPVRLGCLVQFAPGCLYPAQETKRGQSDVVIPCLPGSVIGLC